jgi:hypothetical protein
VLRSVDRDAGVADEHVHRAESLDGLLERGAYGSVVRDVQLHGDGVPVGHPSSARAASAARSRSRAATTTR